MGDARSFQKKGSQGEKQRIKKRKREMLSMSNVFGGVEQDLYDESNGFLRESEANVVSDSQASSKMKPSIDPSSFQ